MATCVDNTNNPQFFQEFHEKCLVPLSDINKYKLVKKGEGYTFEEKSNFDFSSLFHIIFGTAYSIDHHARQFLLIAKENLRNLSLDIEHGHELLACSKTCRTISKILKHVYKRRDTQFNILGLFGRTRTTEERSLLKETSYQSLCQASQILSGSPLSLACINKMTSSAFRSIREGASLKEAEGHYTFLLEKAYKKNYPKAFILRLIALGGNFLCTELPIDNYLFFAIEEKNSQAAIILIDAGADVTQVDRNGNTLLHLACLQQLEEVVKKLLSKKVDCQKVNRQGNTALHISCNNSNAPITRLLVQAKANIFRKNSEGLSPFQIPLKKFRFSEANSFYFSYFENDQSPSFNQLEKSFLLQNLKSAKEIVQLMTYPEFLFSIEKLTEKYPESCLAQIELSHLTMNTVHLRKGNRRIVMESPPSHIDLKMLLELFDTINATNPRFPIHSRKALEKFISTIENRIVYQGTPSDGSHALTEFYDHIEKAVKNTINTLIEIGNQELQFSVIMEYIQASPFCGGRYYNEVTKQYLRICKKTAETFEDIIYESLSNLRGVLFQAEIPQNGHNVNDYNYILRRLGSKYSLPGAEMFEAYKDPYGGANLQEIERKFLTAYTAVAIVKDWIEAQINDDYVLRNKFIDWSLSNIPKGWQKERFNPIIAKIEEMEQEGADQTEKNKFLEAAHVGILDPLMPPLQSIQKEKEASYLATEVFDMETGKIKIQSIAYMLVKLEVFSSCFSLEEKESFDPFKAITSMVTEVTSGPVKVVSSVVAEVSQFLQSLRFF